ncbi:SCP2 sterol-binding domain-containing protein [Acidiferrimicrobium sp. IK]|uniref:SCP2 sterol-binding domain-containing protein n=1 Tax=Acidiferrimicrobium sp. IK TaxID=2871700 RepID=UPI0021CB21BE|nr:SCP2 sterol-binding domain-containing protein [Acidiferrimicrobium sp. IK]MCU4186525.1 SCP2 sterol-binding domain-containing protein [Acidiferrimicrobium sp. IK]
MAKFAFLSDEWVEEARRIRAEYAGRAPAPPVPVRMNQVVKGVPFGDGVVEAHLDTTSGDLDLETGHLESPDLTITVEYETARAILVDGDPQAAMQAFMSGRIKVDGDITKLLTLQSSGVIGAVDPASIEMARRIQEITE